jgi:hypothetical protein
MDFLQYCTWTGSSEAGRTDGSGLCVWDFEDGGGDDAHS